MSRYFLEVAYKGTAYAGFQIQENANSIQSEVQKALLIFYKSNIDLTGASRTDAGVHALQNFFHFDAEDLAYNCNHLYNLNAILPDDIVIKNCYPVLETQHCRFDATARSYEYKIYNTKNPFLKETAFFYPYPLDVEKLNEAAKILIDYTNFTSFSKKNTQVNNFNCNIHESVWIQKDQLLIYNVTANRFLRGMVRGLVGTMLKVGTGKCSIQRFIEIITSLDCSKADFSTPPQGLFLTRVRYPETLFK